MVMDSCGPLVRVLNTVWGEPRIISLNWVWELTPEAVVLGDACTPPVLIRPAAGIATGYITSLTATGPVHVPNEEWTESGAPGNPNSVSFGAGLWEFAWIAEEGVATIDPVNEVGEGAGSIIFPIFGFQLNGEIGCYIRPDENPEFGNTGVGKISTGFPVPNTGQIVSLTWPSISITNIETGETWTNFQYAVNGTFQTITLTLTYNEEEQ